MIDGKFNDKWKKNKKLNLLIYTVSALTTIPLAFLAIKYLKEGATQYLIIEVIMSASLIFTGWFYKFYPPSYFKSLNFKTSGYNSWRAKKDEEHWYKAQELFSEYNLKFGVIYLLFDIYLLVSIYLGLKLGKGLLGGIIIFKTIIWGVGSFIYIEPKLKAYFNEK